MFKNIYYFDRLTAYTVANLLQLDHFFGLTTNPFLVFGEIESELEMVPTDVIGLVQSKGCAIHTSIE